MTFVPKVLTPDFTRRVPAFINDLDTPLLRVSPHDVVTARHACGGFHFWGGIGAGKTTAATVLAGAFCRAGFGGYATISKFEDIGMWKSYAQKHGRGNSVIVFDENEGFNFLDYNMARHGLDGIGTTVECLMCVIDAARRASGTASQRGGDVFWEDSMRTALRYLLPVLYSAKGSLSIPDIIRFISTAPMNLKQPTDREWQEGSFMYKVMVAAARSPKVRMSVAALEKTIEFWAVQWPAIPEKTQGNIRISLTAALDRFNHGRLNRVFCGKTTIVPELSFHGAVILDAKPTLTWGADGVIAQQLFKFIWQTAVLSRNSLEEKHRERFLFLWSDEAQETVNSYDGEFLSLCRASKCSTVYLTQSLPNYYAKIGGDNPRDAAQALAGKFMTHVFCSNSCPETNEFAARVIGKVVKQHRNYSSGTSESVNYGMNSGASVGSGSSSNFSSSSSSSSGGQNSTSSSSSFGRSSNRSNSWGTSQGKAFSSNESSGCTESVEYAIEPGDFARMFQTGGPENGNRVTGIWFQTARVFKATGTNWLLGKFAQ